MLNTLLGVKVDSLNNVELLAYLSEPMWIVPTCWGPESGWPNSQHLNCGKWSAAKLILVVPCFSKQWSPQVDQSKYKGQSQKDVKLFTILTEKENVIIPKE